MTTIAEERIEHVLISGPEDHLQLIGKFLRTTAIGNKPAFDFSTEQKTTMICVADDIMKRIDNQVVSLFFIWARARRRLRYLFRKEPDIYIGTEYGRNFIEACQNYFINPGTWKGTYNRKKNTFAGYVLFPGRSNEQKEVHT